RNVTGVQTSALPISVIPDHAAPAPLLVLAGQFEAQGHAVLGNKRIGGNGRSARKPDAQLVFTPGRYIYIAGQAVPPARGNGPGRSEERRVGRRAAGG